MNEKNWLSRLYFFLFLEVLLLAFFWDFPPIKSLHPSLDSIVRVAFEKTYFVINLIYHHPNFNFWLNQHLIINFPSYYYHYYYYCSCYFIFNYKIADLSNCRCKIAAIITRHIIMIYILKIVLFNVIMITAIFWQTPFLFKLKVWIYYK